MVPSKWCHHGTKIWDPFCGIITLCVELTRLITSILWHTMNPIFSYFSVKCELLLKKMFNLMKGTSELNRISCTFFIVLLFIKRIIFGPFIYSNYVLCCTVCIWDRVIGSSLESHLWLPLAFCPNILGGGSDLWMVLCHSMNVDSVMGIPWGDQDT